MIGSQRIYVLGYPGKVKLSGLTFEGPLIGGLLETEMLCQMGPNDW
jgi:hypothetical protein